MSKEYNDVIKKIYDSIGLTENDSKQFLDNHMNLNLDPEYNEIIDKLVEEDKQLKEIKMLSPELLNKLATLQGILVSKNNKLEKYIKELKEEKQANDYLQKQLEEKDNIIKHEQKGRIKEKQYKEFVQDELTIKYNEIVELKNKLENNKQELEANKQELDFSIINEEQMKKKILDLERKILYLKKKILASNQNYITKLRKLDVSIEDKNEKIVKYIQRYDQANEKLGKYMQENEQANEKLKALQKAINDKLDVINPYLAKQKEIINNKYYKYKNKYLNLKNNIQD